jgi:hypothetical protein
MNLGKDPGPATNFAAMRPLPIRKMLPNSPTPDIERSPGGRKVENFEFAPEKLTTQAQMPGMWTSRLAMSGNIPAKKPRKSREKRHRDAFELLKKAEIIEKSRRELFASTQKHRRIRIGE